MAQHMEKYHTKTKQKENVLQLVQLDVLARVTTDQANAENDGANLILEGPIHTMPRKTKPT